MEALMARILVSKGSAISPQQDVGQAPSAPEPCPGRVSSLPRSYYSTDRRDAAALERSSVCRAARYLVFYPKAEEDVISGKILLQMTIIGQILFWYLPSSVYSFGFQNDTSSDDPVLPTPLDSGTRLPRGRESFPVLLFCKDPVTLKVVVAFAYIVAYQQNALRPSLCCLLSLENKAPFNPNNKWGMFGTVM